MAYTPLLWAEPFYTAWFNKINNQFSELYTADGQNVKLTWNQTIVGTKNLNAISWVGGNLILQDNWTNDWVFWENSWSTDRNFNIYDFWIGAVFTILKSNGFVWIHNTNPRYQLTVNGDVWIELYSSGTQGKFLNFRPSLPPHDYNISICAYDHNTDNNADWLSINWYDGVSFCTGSNTRQERARITVDGKFLLGTLTGNSKFAIAGLPTSSAWLSSGDIWNNSGILTII
jgi:hypothetical protein